MLPDRYVDGRDPGAMADIDEDRMLKQFEAFDTNTDGLLNLWELEQLMKDAHREDLRHHVRCVCVCVCVCHVCEYVYVCFCEC